MIRTFVSIILSGILLSTSLASAQTPLLNQSMIRSARNYAVTAASGTSWVGTWKYSHVLSNKKLFDAGVRNMRVVSQGSADYLVLMNGQNQILRTVAFNSTNPAALQKFKPSTFRQLMTVTGAAKVGHIAKEKLMHFPREAMGFFLAIGAITFMQIAHDLAKNPMAMQQFLDGQWDGHSQFSFYLFMVAAGVAAAPFEEALRQKNRRLLGHFVNYYAMSAGMLASHLYNDVMKIPGMRECAWTMLTAQATKILPTCDTGWEEYMKTWRDPDQREARMHEFSLAGMNLLASAGLAALFANGVEKVGGRVLVALGINIGTIFLPGGMLARAPRIASWTFTWGRSAINALNFMAWTHLIEEPMTAFYENAISTGPELYDLSRCMGIVLERQNTPASNKPEDVIRTAHLDRLISNHCKKSLPEYYDRLYKVSVRWRNENMTPVINSQKAWESHLTELSTYYRMAERFYQDVVVGVASKRKSPELVHPMDAKMIYFGVTPQTYSNDAAIEAREQQAREERLETRRALEQFTVQGEDTMPPLYRAPLLVQPPNSDSDEQKPEFSWGIYLLNDFKGLEDDQDKHFKFVVRRFYRFYLTQIKKHQELRPLTERELERAKILLERLDRFEKLRDPLAQFRMPRLAPADDKLPKAELARMRELIKKLAAVDDKGNVDREGVAAGILELYQSISPELTGDSVKVQDRKLYSAESTAVLDTVYKALGQPLPMKDIGRGYLMAWNLNFDETARKVNEKPTETPFPRMNRAIHTPTASEYLTTTMIYGPDVDNGEDVVGINRNGFKSIFNPPKLIPSGRVYMWNRTHIQENTNDKYETVYTKLIWLDSDKAPGCNSSKKSCYKPVFQWIREGHFKPEVLTGTDTQLFPTWWDKKTRAPYLDAWLHFEQSYETVIKKFLTALYGEDKNAFWVLPSQRNETSALNASEFKNGVLSALNQERSIALFFLSRVLDGQFQINFPKDRPQTVTLMKQIAANPQIAPSLQPYQTYWQASADLFLRMKAPLALVEKEVGTEKVTENKWAPRLNNQTLVTRFQELNKMTDEMEKRLNDLGEIRDDEHGVFKESVAFQLAQTALKSLRNSHEEMLDLGLIINSVSYVELHEDRSNPVWRRCLKTSKAGGAVPFGGNANSARPQQQPNCP